MVECDYNLAIAFPVFGDEENLSNARLAVSGVKSVKSQFKIILLEHFADDREHGCNVADIPPWDAEIFEL
jgi:hypothetical protein